MGRCIVKRTWKMVHWGLISPPQHCLCSLWFVLYNLCSAVPWLKSFPSYVLNFNTLHFEDRFVSPSSGLLFPKQISLHGDYLHCNALWLTSDGYSNQDISNALYARNKQRHKTENPTDIAMLPYQHAASNKISRLLAKCDMKTHHLPVKKMTQGKIGLKTPDVWCVQCGWGKVYVRQAGV